MNKIAIWAPLRYANYGDDLQAIILALHLRSLNIEPILYQLDNNLAKMYKLEVAKNLEELCKNSKLCFIAGGALLTPFIIPKQILHRAAFEYEKDFHELNNAAKKYKTLFCPISIGGDGCIHNPYLYYSLYRIKFFKSNYFLEGTDRLEGDITQLKKFGKNFTYHADMLFQTPDYATPIPLPQSPKYRIALNLKKGKYIDQSLIDSMINYANSNDDLELYFVTTHMEHTGINYQYLPIESKNVHSYYYENIDQLLGILLSSDLIISSMLHIGLTGLTYGTPILSYRGPNKTKTFLKSIGGEWAILNDNISFEELRKSFLFKSKKELYNCYNVQIIERMKEDSLGHFNFIKETLKQYGS